jgi:hypothetical protein
MPSRESVGGNPVFAIFVRTTVHTVDTYSQYEVLYTVQRKVPCISKYIKMIVS